MTATANLQTSAAAKRLVYLVLGASGSGRRKLVRELAAGGLGDEAVALLVSAQEAVEKKEVTGVDPSVAAYGSLPTVATWAWEPASAAQRSQASGAVAGRIVAEWPPATSVVFLIADGRSNPVDQVEALKPWLVEHGAELGRILCVVNCQLAANCPEVLPWLDACIHFSDVVLLGSRDGISNKWLSDFKKRYSEQCYPCLFEFVRKDGVANPLVVLETQARRISQYFEEDDALDIEGLVIESDNGAIDADEADADEALPEDPYLARRLGGRRVREIPDISQLL